MTQFQMRPHVPRPRVSREYYTVTELATRLRISKMTVYRYIHAGTIEAVQFGKQFRIAVTEVERIQRSGL